MGKLVLVVDDEPLIVDTLAEVLTWDGYEVDRAANGMEALAKIAVRLPDILLTDFMMPVKDGLAMIRELRAAEATANMPIVLMTAAPQPGDYDVLLVKPFKAGALRKALEEAVALRKR